MPDEEPYLPGLEPKKEEKKKEKKEEKKGKPSTLWILIGIGIIVALVIAFIVWWRSYTLIKIVIFILLLWLIRAILIGLFGVKPTTASIFAVVICLILMTMVFPATMYANIQNTGAKTITSLKQGKKFVCCRTASLLFESSKNSRMC